MVKSGGLLLGLRQCVELEKPFLKVCSGEKGKSTEWERQSKAVSSDNCPLFKWLNVAGLRRNNRVRVILMGCDA